MSRIITPELISGCGDIIFLNNRHHMSLGGFAFQGCSSMTSIELPIRPHTHRCARLLWLLLNEVDATSANAVRQGWWQGWRQGSWQLPWSLEAKGTEQVEDGGGRRGKGMLAYQRKQVHVSKSMWPGGYSQGSRSIGNICVAVGHR